MTEMGALEIGQSPSSQGTSWLPILMYHRVGDSLSGSDPYNLCVSTAEFERQMRWLRDRGYRSITFEELALMTARANRPMGKPVIITFDDGYRDVYDHAFPILLRHQLTATFFIVSKSIGGMNIWDRGKVVETPLLGLDELKEMRRHGMDFGSHGATHRRLTELDPHEARQEILESKAVLEDRLEMEVLSFSFPFGSSNPALKELVSQAGYLAACGIEQREHSLFNLSRVDVAKCHDSSFQWRWKVSGLHFRLRRNRMLLRSRAVLRRRAA